MTITIKPHYTPTTAEIDNRTKVVSYNLREVNVAAALEAGDKALAEAARAFRMKEAEAKLKELATK